MVWILFYGFRRILVISYGGKGFLAKISEINNKGDIMSNKSSVNLSVLNQEVPDLSLSATGGALVNLKKLKGKTLVVYFYPKDDTPGCTQEGADFTQLDKKFQKLGAKIFGVSKDSLLSHEKFKSKQKYSFDLISDPEGKLCTAFKVLKEKSMFGKKYYGIERSTFVISKAGKIKKEWRKVKVKDHAQEVLAFVKNLNAS